MRLAEQGLVRALPALLPRRFDPQAAGDLEAVFELQVGAAPLTVRVSDRGCRVRRGGCAQAGARLELSCRDLVGMVAGEAAWPQLLSAGRLRLAGDPFLAMRFPPLFRLPAGR